MSWTTVKCEVCGQSAPQNVRPNKPLPRFCGRACRAVVQRELHRNRVLWSSEGGTRV